MKEEKQHIIDVVKLVSQKDFYIKNHQTIHSTDKLTTDVYRKNVTQMQTLRGERTKGKMLRTNVQLSKIRNENKKKS